MANTCIENAFVCRTCSLNIWGADKILAHLNEKHPGANQTLYEYREFKNMILEPGGGHMEQNFNSNWLSDRGNGLQVF